MFNNYKDTSGYYSRQPSYQDDTNQSPLVPKEGSNQTSAPPWDLSQPHPTYSYCADQHVPARMPALMQRQVVSYDNTPPLYRSYNNTNNQHVLRPKAIITCQSNCNRAGCCSKDVPRVPHHWNLCTDKSNGNVSRSKGVSQAVSQHISSVETGSRSTGSIDCAVKEFPRYHREIAGSDHLGMNIPQFKNDLALQQEGSISKQLSVTSNEKANNPKKDASLQCQRSCAPNCQQYDHQASKFPTSGQTPLSVAAPSVSNQWLCDSQARMWSLQNKQSQCLMPLEGVDMTVNNPVASNYWLEKTRDKSTVSVPTSKSSYQDMFEYQIQQEQHQKYVQHYQDSDRLKMMERVRYQESLRSSQQQASDWSQDIPRKRNLPPYPVPRYANVNTTTRPNHNPLVVNPSLPPTYPYTHSKVPLNYTDPTQYSSTFSATYTQVQSKMVSKSNNSFNPHVHLTHTTNVVPANCIRPTIIQHQPPHFATNVDMNTAQTGKNLQYVSSAQSYNQSYTSCNEVYKNVNYSKNMQVVDKPCLNTPRIIQPYSVYDKNIEPFYKSIFGQNTGSMNPNLMYDKSIPPRQMIYDQSYNTENLQTTTDHQQLDNYMAAFHTSRPTQENVGMQGSHALPQNAVFGQPPSAVSQMESDAFILADGSDRPIKKRKPQLAGYEKPLGMDLRQFIETWEEEPEDVPYQPLPDTDSNKVDFKNLGDTNGMLEETNADSSAIKLYPTDSDGIRSERNNPGTSVIKPLNNHQQSPEQPTLSSEKVDLQEPILHSKTTGNNEPTNSPNGILLNLLSSSEDVASPIGDLLPDNLNGRPTFKIVPGSDDMPPQTQSPCGYERSKQLTDIGNLEQTLRETKRSKSIVAIDDTHDALRGKQCVQSPLKERWHIGLSLAENVNAEQNQVNDINFKYMSNENLNKKLSLPEEIGPNTNTQQYSSNNVSPVNNRNLVNVEDFDQMLPECNSEYMPNSPKNVLNNVLLVDDVDTIKSSITNTTRTDILLECVDSKPSSSKDIPVGSLTSMKPNSPLDSLPLSQNINNSCKSLTHIKSRPTSTGNTSKEKNINTNLPKGSNVKSVSPQVAKIAHRSSSRPRPLSRKRKCFQEKNMEEDATLEDKSSKHLISSPIEAAENTCLMQEICTGRKNLNVESTSKEVVTLESTLTTNKSIDCLDKIMDKGSNDIHEVVCKRLHMPSGMSEVLALPLTKSVAVSSTSTLEGLSPQYADAQLNSEFSSSELKEQWDKNAQNVSVTESDKLLVENEVVNFSDEKLTHTNDDSLVIKSSSPQPTFGLLGINPILTDKCNAIPNAKASNLCGDESPVVADTKSNPFFGERSLHSISRNTSSESIPMHAKETLCKLPEKISHTLQNVVSQITPSSNAVATPPIILDEETQPVIEIVKEKSTYEGLDGSKAALLTSNALSLHPSLSEIPISNEDLDITQFTESSWPTSTVNLNKKKTVKSSQSQQGNIVGNGSSEIDVNTPLNCLSMINSSNTSDSEMNNQVETIKTAGEIQSAGIVDNDESSIDAAQRCQSLDKCSNSVIKYISSEILEESVTPPKHAIAEHGLMYQHPIIRVNSPSNALESCVAEESKAGNKSCPIGRQLLHTDTVKIQEHNVVHDCSRKSKLLSVRIIKKNSNEYSMHNNMIGSITSTDEQSKECSIVGSPSKKLNECVELELSDSRDESDITPVELSNSRDREVNECKTKAFEPSPERPKHIGMAEESKLLITNLEQAVATNGSSVKLPHEQEALSQPYVSCDESNDDVLDLDTSYDFDLQTEGESHSTNKESCLHSGLKKAVSIATVSHKSVDLKSNDEEVEDDGDNLNMGSSYNDSKVVEGSVGIPHGDHAQPNLDILAACIQNVRTSSETISKCDALFIHHEDTLITHAATSFPEQSGKTDSKPQLEQYTGDVIGNKNIPFNPSNKTMVVNHGSLKFTNADDKIQHPIKITSSTKDVEPIACYTSDKSDCTELLNHFETPRVRECKLQADVMSHSTSKQHLVKPQEGLFQFRCNQILNLDLNSVDEPEVLFTKSDQDTNLQTLHKPHLMTDASMIRPIDNSVPSTVNCVTNPTEECRSRTQECITLVNQNLENVKLLGTLVNEGQYQAKELATGTSTENNVCQTLLRGQGNIIGNCENLNVGLQKNKTECSIENNLTQLFNIQNKSPSSSDEVALVIGDSGSTDENASTMFKDKTSGGASSVKDEGLLQDIEAQDHTNKSSDVDQPIDKCEHSPHDGLAIDIPSNRDKLQSLEDLDDVVKCSKCIYATLRTGKCSMADVLIKRLSSGNNLGEVIKRNECECDSKTGNTLGIMIDDDQHSIDTGIDKDLQVNTVGKPQLDNGVNLNIIEANKDNGEHNNATVTPIPLDKNRLSMEDLLTVPKSSDKKSTDNCFCQVKRDMEGYCVAGGCVGLEMDRHTDEHLNDCLIKHSSNIPLEKEEFLLDVSDVDIHSKDCRTKHNSHAPLNEDECSMQVDLDLPLSSRDGEQSEHVNQITNSSEVDCQMSHNSSVEDLAEVEHLKGDVLDVSVSKDNQFMDHNLDKITKDSCESSETSFVAPTEDKINTSIEKRHRPTMNTDDNIKDCLYNSQAPSSLHVEVDEVERLMGGNFGTSVDKGEAHLVNDNKNSYESGYVSHITLDTEVLSVENDVCVPVIQEPQLLVYTNLNKDLDADEDYNQTGKSLDVDVKDKFSKQNGTCKSFRNDKRTSQLDNNLDVNQILLHNDETTSMSDDLGNLVEEEQYMAGISPLKVRSPFSAHKNCAGEDLAKIGVTTKSAVPLLPISITRSVSHEQSKEISHANCGRRFVCVPHQKINIFCTAITNPLQQPHSSVSKLEGESCTNAEQSTMQASSTNIEEDFINTNSKSSMLCEETDDGIVEVNTFYNNSYQEIEMEHPTTSYVETVVNTCNEIASQTCSEVIQATLKSTTESRFVPEYSDILYHTTECQNDSPLDLNLESCRTSEAEAIKVGLPIREMCNEDTLSNSLESPKMPFLEVISDLNLSADQKAACESRCDSDTEMPFLEKFSDSPPSYLKDRRLDTNTKLDEGNCELISESSGNWNCVVQSEDHCKDVSCVDVIPVESVSNWPYLEEEVFSEAQITGSPQVELPCSSLDDVPSDQRFTSSSDTETEPDSLNVPSTNTALDIISYKNRDVDEESLNIAAPSADLKCRLSWKKIFNLAKVEERKKQYRVGEAKNRKEAYRRWPYYGKTGHKRRSLKSPNKQSTSIDKFDKGLSSTEMSSNDVDGLVLGPAKIEFRLAPKAQTERWQVVDGSKSIKLCGEENNNNIADRSITKTLKTQSPIVLVKRIILKRRGDDNNTPRTVHNVPQNNYNYPCSTSMNNLPNTMPCVNRPISSAALSIQSINPLNEANCESEFSCLTTPPESDDSSTSLKTLERLPKVIIKRTGYGNAKYKSFLRLSAAEGSNWQPFVRLERKKYLDNLAKQLFPQHDHTDEDIGNQTELPSEALSMSKHPQEVNNRSSNEDPSTYNVVPTNPDDLTLPESVHSGPVDLHQEHASKKLCKVTYTTMKRHSKDIKLTFQLSNSNKQCTEVIDTDKKIKQGIVHRIIKKGEIDKCQENALKTAKHSARRCSEGGTSQEKKGPEYRARIGSEGANSGSLKPKKRSSNESSNCASWWSGENKSKFAKTNLCDKESVESTGDQYNGAPEKAVTKEHTWKKSLKQKFKVITCQACNYSVKNEVEQSAHIRQHPYHCQKCSVAFKSEDDFKSHLSIKHPLTKELHHCLLCKISFPSAEQHQQHLSDRQHRHLDLTQRWTIQTLFKMFTGEGCSRITPLTDSEVTEMSKLTDAEPGAINYYHQATPLQLAVQDLLKQSRKLPNAGGTVSSPRQHQDASDLM